MNMHSCPLPTCNALVIALAAWPLFHMVGTVHILMTVFCIVIRNNEKFCFKLCIFGGRNGLLVGKSFPCGGNCPHFKGYS